MRKLWIIALAAAAVGPPPLEAEETKRARPRVLFFRKPDRQTEKDIRAEIKHLNGSSNLERYEARRALEEIGLWAVPFLAVEVAGPRKAKANRVRMNAVFTLARILDPYALPNLRLAAFEDRNVWVQRAALLSLGVYKDQVARRNLLARLSHGARARGESAVAAAIALGRLGDDESAARLLAAARSNGPDFRRTAASLIGAAVATSRDDIPKLHGVALALLDHKEELVRRAAALALAVRPGTEPLAGPLRTRIAKEQKKLARAALYLALAALPRRSEETRRALLNCACNEREKVVVRTVAAIGLAEDMGPGAFWIDTPEGRKLHLHAVRRAKNRHLTGALLFAYSRTGRPDVTEELIKLTKTGIRYARLYAVGCLGHLVSFRPTGADGTLVPLPQEKEVWNRLARMANVEKDKDILRLVEKVRSLSWHKLAVDRPRKARAAFLDVTGIDRKRLWSLTPRARTLAALNNLIFEVMDLDYVEDIVNREDFVGKPGQPPTKAKEGGGGGGGDDGGSGPGGGASSSKSAEENDLRAFLSERPYYEVQDVGS